MTNKFTIGSQYLTKGGWRAVVVDVKDKYLTLCHVEPAKIIHHNLDGKSIGPGFAPLEGGYCLERPYTEPLKGTVWVNVWEDVTGGIQALCTTTEQEFKDIMQEHAHFNWIASFKHDWTEGDKI